MESGKKTEIRREGQLRPVVGWGRTQKKNDEGPSSGVRWNVAVWGISLVR